MMIGSIEREARRAVMDPPADHLLGQTAPDDRSVLELIEPHVDPPCAISREVPREMRRRKHERYDAMRSK